MVPVASGTLLALEWLILWLLWVVCTFGLMILFALFICKEPSTLRKGTYKCLALVHEEMLSELVFCGKPFGAMLGSWFCQCISS